jgi:hypothetical protein
MFCKGQEFESKPDPGPKDSKSENKKLFEEDYPREYIMSE